MPLLEILLATRNPGKVRELRALLDDLPVRLLVLDAFPKAPEVDEDRPTLEGNARKKAETLHAFTGLPALADDTGLEVDALDGRPGVHTARFAGPDASEAANRDRLLDVLDGEDHRTARFRTVMAFAEKEGSTRCVEGVCPGSIAREERGEGGFGYDELFVPDGYQRTFAELSAEEKNAISHRRRALDAFKKQLEDEMVEERRGFG